MRKVYRKPSPLSRGTDKPGPWRDGYTAEELRVFIGHVAACNSDAGHVECAMLKHEAQSSGDVL